MTAAEPELFSEIVCPECGHKKTEEMPTVSCIYFYECRGCETQLKPLAGDCCVFCSFGSVKCPPMQTGDGGERKFLDTYRIE